MRAAFRSLMNQRCVHAAYLGRDTHGVPTFGPGVVRRCRAEVTHRPITKPDGAIVVPTARLFVDGAGPAIGAEDRLEFTLPDGRVVIGGPLVAPSAVPELDGTISHYEVLA
jgi:hypothetical protein